MAQGALTTEQQLLHDCAHALADAIFVLVGRQVSGASARMPMPGELASRAQVLIGRIKQALEAKLPPVE